MTRRMVKAELLKLVKRRGVVIAALLLTVGIVVIVMVVPELYHLRHGGGPGEGGYRGMFRGATALGFLGSVAALIVGSAAGTGDLSSGIFRDLVATGRSRWALFAARVPGALIFFVPAVTLAYAIMAGFDDWFSNGSGLGKFGCPAPGAPICNAISGIVPSGSAFLHWYLWVLLVTCFDLLVALGLASWLGSRSLTIGILLPFQLIVAPLLSNVTQLAGVREALFPQSFIRLSPPRDGIGAGIQMFGLGITSSVAVAWLVLVAWVVVLIGAGAWRTATRDA